MVDRGSDEMGDSGPQYLVFARGSTPRNGGTVLYLPHKPGYYGGTPRAILQEGSVVLLKLKRVEIQGFKSFYDRTEMKFNGSGIAAVVGPNGCGKSNLSDAISWVLGEQSAKTLRGSRMEDVIFAGTRDKKPLSMASVTMTLVPDENTVPDDPEPDQHPAIAAELNGGGSHLNGQANGAANGMAKTELTKAVERRGEITITRRLYRSGDSEYLINGKIARLRDIQELFLGTGLGPESYAIIEQGRIGQILSNKPQDRRNVIEEAAGITKFKTRKRLAEARLESAKQNLSRVFDILEEVNRQVNSLKRQAAKTKRYAELKAEGAEYLRQVLAARFRMLERETAKLAIELNLVSAELHSLQTSIGEHEKDQVSLVENSYATEHRLVELRQTLSDMQLDAERARGKIEYQAKQIQQIDERLALGGQESRLLDEQQIERGLELEQQTSTFKDIEAQCSNAHNRLQACAAERQQAQNRLTAHERALDDARQRVLRLLSESSSLTNRITQVEAQLASIDRDRARAASEEQQSQSDLARVQRARSEVSETLSARQAELISLTDQRQFIERQLQEERLKLGELRQTVDRSGAELSRIKARRDSLEDIIQHRSYTTETVKRLFTAVEDGKAQDFKPVGVLADFLEVDPRFERAAEEFLHEELEYVVVRSWADAERGIELMYAELNGRATFLVEAADEPAATAAFPVPALEPNRLSRLTDSLRLTNGLTNLPLHLLPRIANCYVAADRDLARRLAADFPHCWFLSPEGFAYQGQVVSGGKKLGAGPLALKRELRELTQLEQTRQQELTAAQDNLSKLERSIAGLNDDLEHLRSRQQAQEKDVLALDHESRKLAEELQRIQTRLSHARLELDRVARDAVKLQETAERDRAALVDSETARASEENALETAREELTGLQTAFAHANESHAALRASLASLEERQRSAVDNCIRLETQLDELSTRRAHLTQETERFTRERGQLLSSNEELEARRTELREAISGHEESVAGLAEHGTELRSRLAAQEEQLKNLRAQANSAQERRSELQIALARAESDLKHLEETCHKELETTLAQLAEGMETVADESALQELDARYAEVRRKIEALGPVNPQALEEFEETQQRQEFLTAQRQDLLDSIRDTEKAIHEIDAESRKRFTEAFRAINDNFREMFQTLFGGGVGEMRLTDEENVAESGIDIVASPPGKKLQSVLLLSGGEKSLTAMALLMGIFQYTPSPFCILDEVDAPLDEPNIERLTRLIREMSEQTQFIVITHAKRTMEAAQSLYGVTMQEPGVSKLVSVKFKQPQPETRAQQMESAMA